MISEIIMCVSVVVVFRSSADIFQSFRFLHSILLQLNLIALNITMDSWLYLLTDVLFFLISKFINLKKEIAKKKRLFTASVTLSLSTAWTHIISYGDIFYFKDIADSRIPYSD